MLVLSRRDVETLLDLDELIDALARAHAELSAGSVSMPARIAAFAPSGLLGAMPAYLPSVGLGAKLVSLFPKNTAPLPPPRWPRSCSPARTHASLPFSARESSRARHRRCSRESAISRRFGLQG